MTLSLPVLTFRYSLFAVIATAVNVSTQMFSASIYPGTYELPVAMALGTGTGLVTKYILDKHYIFYDCDSSISGHSIKFILYTLMGIFTTGIFWGTELAFELMSGDATLRYFGAVLGLTVGYMLKYQLDRRLVFPAQVR